MRSVYQRVLGERFEQLDPLLRAYFGETRSGAVGRGSGVYETAGSRQRWLRPALAWLAWRHVLFPEYGHNIPFQIFNTTNPDGTLSARREFSFRSATRVMEDTMSVVDGTLHDRLGRRRGLEVEFALGIVAGGLQMQSRRQWLRVGRVRFRIPGLVRVALIESASGGQQHVDVRMSAPGLGEVFSYSGTFSYSVE